MSKSLEACVTRLERIPRRNSTPTMIFLDVPGGKPDRVFYVGKSIPVPDGRQVLAQHPGMPIKLYSGMDPDLF